MNLLQEAFGAQILQAQYDAKSPIFYLSPISKSGIPRRGGVPILFPQFADSGPFAKHGFVRNLDWDCIKRFDDGVLQQGTNSHYCLDIAPNIVSGWDHHARLDFITHISANELVLTLKVANLGLSSFSWTGGLHPYFYVDDVLKTGLLGLTGSALIDRYDSRNNVDQSPLIIFNDEPCERLYQSNLPVRLETQGRVLKLSSTGFSEWMIWNPGSVDSVHFADLPQGDWRHFICVEPVSVTNPILIEPGKEFCGSLSISW
ncbi:D-hexose-6-phosphate mutarotase [Polynucleobacter paneuropaeus]|nr:D-hexose-6-phosphate mutarotase [Polynucleobacter paneuropaeus]MBT8638559.1 D-hexose-6-phosphate mutarotase [Polynucleobacter paneuropaeus]